MKQFTMLIAVALAGSVLVSGCGKTEQAPPSPAAPAAAKPAPATAPPVSPSVAAPQVDLVASAKSGVEQAMALANDGKYQDALALLQKKPAEVQANPEAKKLIDDAVAKVKQMMADAATKAGGALGGLAK